jgi:hypothetical protein
MTWPDAATAAAPSRGRRPAGGPGALGVLGARHPGARWGALAAAALPAGALLAGALLAAGCHRGRPEGFLLRPLVEAGRYTVGPDRGAGLAGLRFPVRPALADLEIDHERRPVVLTTAAPWTWTGRVPPRAALHAGLQLAPAAWARARRRRLETEAEAVAVLTDGRTREVLQVVR